MKWIINFVRRRGSDRQLAQEVEAHLEEKMADLMDSGIPEQEARQRARREFGNVALNRQDSREAWGWVWLETLVQDLRYGARILRRNPGFTSVAVLSLAIGIGVNSTMFSLADGLLLRPLSVSRPSDRQDARLSVRVHLVPRLRRFSGSQRKLRWAGGV
jgi:hypothetical protein